MAELTTLDDLIERSTGGAGAQERLWFIKDPLIGTSAPSSPVAGGWTSLWRYNGTGGSGAVPTTAAVPTRATAGALGQANPGGGRQKWVTSIGAIPGRASPAGTLLLYDRLLHRGGLSGTSTGAQTVGGAVDRYIGASSAGNQVWLEVYTAVGNGASTVTCSYTNQDGTSGRTTRPLLLGSSVVTGAQRATPFTLAAGDTGVRSVETLTLAASTGTVGDFGVTIVRPLYFMFFDTEAGNWRNGINLHPGPQEVLTDACLALMWQSVSTTAPSLYGAVYSVEA